MWREKTFGLRDLLSFSAVQQSFFLSLPLSFSPSDLHRSKEGDDGEGGRMKYISGEGGKRKRKKVFGLCVCVGGGGLRRKEGGGRPFLISSFRPFHTPSRLPPPPPSSHPERGPSVRNDSIPSALLAAAGGGGKAGCTSSADDLLWDLFPLPFLGSKAACPQISLKRERVQIVFFLFSFPPSSSENDFPSKSTPSPWQAN